MGPNSEERRAACLRSPVQRSNRTESVGPASVFPGGNSTPRALDHGLLLGVLQIGAEEHEAGEHKEPGHPGEAPAKEVDRILTWQKKWTPAKNGLLPGEWKTRGTPKKPNTNNRGN